MPKINVTKAFLPPKNEYLAYLDKIWDAVWLTNNGPLLQELEHQLKQTLQLPNLMVCNNGTIVLQMAIKALQLKGSIITTPFSYVATTNAILWEQCKPAFVDIDPVSLCIDPNKIEAAITSETSAILCTHVYGFPCDVDKIQAVADKYQLKVIYDAAHAFGVTYKNKSLFSYGDVSTCSFHATKLFHTVEGGLITSNDSSVAQELYLQRQFGHVHDAYYTVGVNGKNSELHAAMGLSVLPHVPRLIMLRKAICQLYDQLLQDKLEKPHYTQQDVEYNYSYYPVLFNDEASLLKIKAALEADDIYPRRYFYPSLNTLPFLTHSESCPIAENISKRVLCLPLYPDLAEEDVHRIARIIVSNL